VVEPLDARLCLSGHGRTFTDIGAHIEGNRTLVHERLEAAAAGLDGQARTALELAPAIYGEPLAPAMATWRLTETMCILRHLEAQGRVAHEPDGAAERWRLT
jgi:hypothetical protein